MKFQEYLCFSRSWKDQDMSDAGVFRCGELAMAGSLSEPLVGSVLVVEQPKVGVRLHRDQASRQDGWNVAVKWTHCLKLFRSVFQRFPAQKNTPA